MLYLISVTNTFYTSSMLPGWHYVRELTLTTSITLVTLRYYKRRNLLEPLHELILYAPSY